MTISYDRHFEWCSDVPSPSLVGDRERLKEVVPSLATRPVRWDRRRKDFLRCLVPSVRVGSRLWIGDTFGPDIVVGVRVMKWGRGRVDLNRHRD